MNLPRILDTAVQIVQEAGPIARASFGHAAVVREKAHGDYATEGDLRVEAFILDRLERAFPDHAWDSEERGRRPLESDFVWILDPIDGTKYYFRGIALYSISMALEHRGQLILGVVYNPETADTFSAALGLGARRSGKPIRCSTVERLEEATLCLEIPSRNSSSDERQWAAPRIGDLIAGACRIRILAVGALGLCYCAAGGFDAYVNLSAAQKYCDTAAGRVILTESGGQFVSFGARGVGGPPSLCRQLVARLGPWESP